MQEHSKLDGSIGGERLGGHGAPTVYGRNRVCASPSCDTRLSIYNSAECCALHDKSAIAVRLPRGLPRRRRSPKAVEATTRSTKAATARASVSATAG